MPTSLATVRLGQLATFEMGQSPDSSSVSESVNGMPFLQGNAEFGPIHPQHRLRCSRPRKMCKCGDILISVRAPVGSLNKADQQYCIGRGLAAVRFTEVSPHFGWHLLSYWSSKLDRVAQGTTFEAIGKSELGDLKVDFLPEVEQHRITSILDTMDAAIQQTEALIAKLKQMKAGLLHDLLTRGIDEQGQLRDPIAHPEQFKESASGRIPRDWVVRPLKSLAEIDSGVTLGRNLGTYGTVELPYLRVANVQDGYLDLQDVKTVRIRKDELSRFMLQPGDVLMNEGGDFDKLGRGAVWCGQISPCLHQNHVFRVRPQCQQLRSAFLAAVSGSHYGKRFFILSSKQSTNLASINSTQLKHFPIPCPSVEEQDRIISELEAADDRIRAEESYVHKLRLQKQGLMDDLLTGRVRVPEALEATS